MQDYINCFSCKAKVQKGNVQYSYGNSVCPNCYKNFQKIAKTIESDIDPYTLPLTNEQREARNRVRGVLVDDVAYVKCNMEKQLFEELYFSDLNRSTSDSASSVYLFNYSEEARIYFDKKYEIPYMQFWYASEFAFHPSTFRGPSNKYPISFYEVELFAKATSDALYEKYKGINKFNWKEYI